MQFGFAKGFQYGAMGSVAQQVIFKCILKATSEAVPEDCQQYDFYLNHPYLCDEYVNDRKYWYYLITQG